MRKSKNKLKIIVTAVCAALCLCILPSVLSGRFSAKAAGRIERADSGMADSGLNYSESTENMVNPDRGFYQALQKTVPTDSSSALWEKSAFDIWCKQFGIMHLRLGLENFSANAGGVDGPISDSALQSIENTLAEIRRAGGTAIVRFSYDADGTYKNNEPSMELVETHIAQLGELLSRNLDVVTSLETGMFGPWGEQHSTTLAQSGADTYFRLVEAWLKALPDSRTISVRQPLYYRYWFNKKYGENLTENNMSSNVSVKGTDAYRVGVYNDGYLGSSTDLGTFRNRDVEVAWLDNQAAHTLYGGEVVADSESGLMGKYNDAAYVEQEAFITHTSYLNQAWNDKVVSHWNTNKYGGNDPVYNGESQYRYIATHLGYRFVLRKSELSASVARGGTFVLKGSIENVGFGNVINEKVAQIMLVGGGNTYTCNADLDVREITSQTTKDYEMQFRLPSDIPAGEYDVYIRIRGKEEKSAGAARAILFANVNGYNLNTRANKLGKLSVNTQVVQGSDAFEQVGGTAAEFTVTFAAESGVTGLPQAITATGGSNVTLPSSVPVRGGYVFAGWSDGSKTYKIGDTYRVLQNVTLSAVWEKATYTVKFNGNGGTLTEGEETQSVKYLEAATAPVYEKTGHTFAGWSGEFGSITGDTEITAQWDPVIYTVRFLSREDAELVSGDATQNIAYGTAATPPVYKRNGYKLVGWSGDFSEIKGHGVFYAVWEAEAETAGDKKGCKNGLSASLWAGLPLAGLGAVLLAVRKRKSVNNK